MILVEQKEKTRKKIIDRFYRVRKELDYLQRHYGNHVEIPCLCGIKQRKVFLEYREQRCLDVLVHSFLDGEYYGKS